MFRTIIKCEQTESGWIETDRFVCTMFICIWFESDQQVSFSRYQSELSNHPRFFVFLHIMAFVSHYGSCIHGWDLERSMCWCCRGLFFEYRNLWMKNRKNPTSLPNLSNSLRKILFIYFIYIFISVVTRSFPRQQRHSQAKAKGATLLVDCDILTSPDIHIKLQMTKSQRKILTDLKMRPIAVGKVLITHTETRNDWKSHGWVVAGSHLSWIDLNKSRHKGDPKHQWNVHT